MPVRPAVRQASIEVDEEAHRFAGWGCDVQVLHSLPGRSDEPPESPGQRCPSGATVKLRCGGRTTRPRLAL